MGKPLVALVGRPNVGKSTLFNRIVGTRVAIVEDVPGTTRDRIYGDAEWAGRRFTLIDTGGLDLDAESDIPALVARQARHAIDEADVIVFLVDARSGPTASDHDIANILRQTKKPVILAVNKADNERRRLDAAQFYELGLGDPLPISALHGTGTGDLLDLMVAGFPPVQPEPEALARIAIVGRPNVGKSSLLNALVGRERAIVSEIPGTTRDAIDTALDHPRGRVILIDTAGIRRRGRVEPGVEQYSVLRALRAIDRCDVALLLVDASEGLTAQDTHIAGYIQDVYKGCIVIVNKWDLVPKGQRDTVRYTVMVRQELNFMDFVPVLFVSAKTGQRIDRILDLALDIREQRRIRVQTSALNTLLEEVLARHNPPTDHGRQLRIYYATQAAIDPPTFVFFVNDRTLVHFSYARYLENQLREAFGFTGTPIKLVFRPRETKS